MRRALGFATLLAALAPSVARAEAVPPPGWEAPPPLLARADPPDVGPGKLRAAACCAFDATCCTRQTDLDAATPDREVRAVEVRFADLPELFTKLAAEGEAPIVGAPGLRVADGLGRPAPWPDGPKLEVRIVPLGRYGDLAFGDDPSRHWKMPFFRAKELAGMGSGVSIGVAKRDASAVLAGRIDYTTIDQSGDGPVTIDYVTGRLAGSPAVVVSRWAHAATALVTDGFVHAFRGWTPDAVAEGSEGDAVTFLLPEIILGFESEATKHEGGFLAVRGSSDVAFTTFSLPIGPGRSGLARFRVLDNEIRRWFPPPPGTKAPARVATVVLSTSWTHAEGAPRVRVVFLNE
jgi:hypothetical protein